MLLHFQHPELRGSFHWAVPVLLLGPELEGPG